MDPEIEDKRLDPMSDFKKRLIKRRKAISKGLIVPNFVDEYTKSKMILVFFFVVAFFNYKRIDSLILRYNLKEEDPLVQKIRNNIEQQNKIQVQENSSSNRILDERFLQDSSNQQNHEVISDGDFMLTDADKVNIVTTGLMIINLICICFGNSPQFNVKCLIILAMLCSFIIFAGQIFLIIKEMFDANMFIASLFLLIGSVIAVFTSDQFYPGALYFSNFNADRAFVYNEYVFQRLFGRVSLFWGMRFGKYKKYSKHIFVKQEFPDGYLKNDKPNSDSKDNDQFEGDKYLSNKLESMRDIDTVSQITRPTSPSRSNRSIWEGDKSFNLTESHHYKMDYEKLYKFYQKNDIKHSFIIKKKEQILLKLPKYMEKRFIYRMTSLFKSFGIYKRRLFQKYPFYFPTKIIIAVTLQIFIQVEILIIMINNLIKSFNRDLTWVNFVSNSLKVKVEDLYRSSTISLSIVTLFFIIISIFSTTKTFMAFKMSTLDYRLNGYDHLIDHHSIWYTVKFLQGYLGNAIFATGPFLMIYFLFFWCMFSLTFWQWIFNIRGLWLPIVAVFFTSFILDLIVSHFLSNGRYFKSRKCIQFLDILKIFLGFYSGLFTGFMRFLLSFLFLNMSLFRVDKAGIPNWIYQIVNIDIINKPYISVTKLYHTHNNPIKMIFVNLLIDHCMKIREKQTKQVIEEKQGSELEILDPEDSSKMSPERKKQFLKIAYRWQLFAMMARNTLILEFRKEDRHGDHH